MEVERETKHLYVEVGVSGRAPTYEERRDLAAGWGGVARHVRANIDEDDPCSWVLRIVDTGDPPESCYYLGQSWSSAFSSFLLSTGADRYWIRHHYEVGDEHLVRDFVSSV